MVEIVIKKVNQLETHKLILLVEESASEGFRHVKQLVNAYETGAYKFDNDGEALFITYQNNEIVGVCGLNQDPYANNQDVFRDFMFRQEYVDLALNQTNRLCYCRS